MSDSEIDMEEYKELVKPPKQKKKLVKPPKQKKENRWMKYVQEYREKNPGVKYTDCLKQAKLTYKKN